MTELRTTGQIPDEDGYWDALATRVAASAARDATSSGSDMAWLAERRAVLFAGSLAVAATLMLAVLPRNEEAASAADTTASFIRALAPSDEMGRVIAGEDTPPTIFSLLSSAAPR